MSKAPRSSLSRAQRELIHLIRGVSLGWIENLVVQDGEPVLSAATVFRRGSVRAGSESKGGPTGRDDGAALRFLEVLRDVGDGVVWRVEIEEGAPVDFVLKGAASRAPGSAQQPVWLTVTEAAELLLDDVSGIDLERAKARVCRAAAANRFRINGERGRRRRIDRDSFSTWRLEQRERELEQ